MRRSLLTNGFLFGALGLVAASACSSNSSDSKSGGENGAGGSDQEAGILFSGGATATGAKTGAGGSGTSGSTGAGGSAGSGVGPNDCPIQVSDACAGQTYVGETIPLDIYVMFDQSGSMLNVEQGGVTRMDAVRTAVGQFLNDQASAGIGVGIGYFGYEPIGQTTCDPADYQNADVPVNLLPDNAQPIIDSLAGREPTGETPTGSAIRGACTYAKGYKLAHPGHEVVILLVTDGEPKAPVTCGSDSGIGPCCPTLSDAVDATTECRSGNPGLKTYVLGVGPFLDNLGQIAIAGGTDKAYLVSGGDVASQVLDALNEIRAAASIPCELNLPEPPPGESLDPHQVNIVYTTNTCETKIIYNRTTSTACDTTEGGWYYDDPTAPSKITLCGKTCDDVAAPGGQLMFSIGCETLVQ